MDQVRERVLLGPCYTQLRRIVVARVVLLGHVERDLEDGEYTETEASYAPTTGPAPFKRSPEHWLHDPLEEKGEDYCEILLEEILLSWRMCSSSDTSNPSIF